MSQVSPSDPNRDNVPIALPEPPMSVNFNDGGSRSAQPGTGCSTSCGGKGFKANTGYDNP